MTDRLTIRQMRPTIDGVAGHEEHSIQKRLTNAGKLRLLFAGDTGADDMGADVRVEEVLRLKRRNDWEGYLPPLAKGLEAILSRYALPEMADEEVHIAAGSLAANETSHAGESNYTTRWNNG